MRPECSSTLNQIEFVLRRVSYLSASGCGNYQGWQGNTPAVAGRVLCQWVRDELRHVAPRHCGLVCRLGRLFGKNAVDRHDGIRNDVAVRQAYCITACMR